SFMRLAPLLFSFGEAEVPNAGGCRLGARPVNRLVEASRSFGVEIKYNSNDGYYYAKLGKGRGAEINFLKKTHTGTELALMLASRVEATSIVGNASSEPEIDDLLSFMIASGVSIKREKDKLLIRGKRNLKAVEKFIQAGVLFAPGKAANAGGVATSGLEMSQNSMRLTWPKQEVDSRLQEIMASIHETVVKAASDYGYPGNYMVGSNIAGFIKVAEAMLAQGVV
ncbi:MAG: hypothetical protein NC911_09950, partial [Candidatus Omnitrophica bacterium]|nr:hypothetical protein [Candidatus Omnitrophota bacterium]